MRIDSAQLVDADSLRTQLSELGLSASEMLIQVSLRRLGRPAGGPATVLTAVRAAVGTHATVVVPTPTPQNSTTSRVFRNAVAGYNRHQVDRYIAAMPGFTASMPSWHGGGFAEYVRQQPGAVRSTHPQTSFAALGPRARPLMAGHDLDCHLGMRSPLGALYRSGGSVLSIGVPWSSCTPLHLAEWRMPRPTWRRYRCFTVRAGRRQVADFVGVDYDDSDFAALGRALENTDLIRTGKVGHTNAMLWAIPPVIDFAVAWLTEHRSHR